MVTFDQGTKIPATREQLHKLYIAAGMFSVLCEGAVHARVREIWCDYGARIYYDQVVIYRDQAETDSFQLSPNDREQIIRANYRSDILHVVLEAMRRHPNLYTERR